MKRMCFIFLLCCNVMYAQEGAKPEHYTMASDRAEPDTVDVLLDDARQNSMTQEAPTVKPVSAVEYWIKRVGTSILISYIQLKQYLAHCMYGEGHEKKDNN